MPATILCKLQLSRTDRLSNFIKAAGLQDAIDCLVPDNISVKQKEHLSDPAHPRFDSLHKVAD
jgi:hypothetical protein